MNYPTLYKRDSKGNLREWRMERDGDRYRTIAGLADGQQVISEWTLAEPKNVGRSNATTGEEQAHAEIEAAYTKKRRLDYHDDVANVDKPLYFKPMLAQSWEKRAGKIKWLDGVWSQPKLDGIRCIATSRGLFSRTGKPILAVPHIEEALAPFFEADPDLVFDGELYNHDLKDDFNSIVSMVRKIKPSDEELALAKSMVEYHIYDLPSSDGIFSERSLTLLELFETHFNHDRCLQFVDTEIVHSEVEADTVYGGYIEAGFEGGIIRLDAPYEQKRSNNLIKRKDFEDDEFEILRIEEGLGNWSGVAKKVFFANQIDGVADGKEVGAGLKGSRDYARTVLQDAHLYVGKKVTVQFFTRTPDGVPRFPIAKILHKEDRI